MGWAAFESNELATAESYLRAAWKLSQRPDQRLQLGRVLEAKGKKAAAAHMYELASVTEADDILWMPCPPATICRERLPHGYKRVTGKELTATSLNHGQYVGSLHAELDKDD